MCGAVSRGAGVARLIIGTYARALLGKCAGGVGHAPHQVSASRQARRVPALPALPAVDQLAAQVVEGGEGAPVEGVGVEGVEVITGAGVAAGPVEVVAARRLPVAFLSPCTCRRGRAVEHQKGTKKAPKKHPPRCDMTAARPRRVRCCGGRQGARVRGGEVLR